MKSLCSIYRHLSTRAYFTAGIGLANEAPESLYDQEHADEPRENIAGLANEVIVDERGWAIIPFGDWPHDLGMQKFHREQAQAIANAFNAVAGKLRRAIVGLPIFKGHPDVPALANQYPDKEEKGQVAAVEVRDTGLAVKLILSAAGADLVAKGWKFISPYWLANIISEGADGRKTFAPALLRSIGLVSRPNIPSPSLANAGQPANQNPPMNPETLKLLGLANVATPTAEQIAEAIKALHTQANSLANAATENTTLKGQITVLEGKVAAGVTDLANAASAKTTAETALANERSARVGEHVSQAIRSGRILIADKAVWEGRLQTNFAAESVALANTAPKVKTASDIPAMLKTLQDQMEKDLANEAKKGGKAAADDASADTGKDECGLGNDELGAMNSAQRQAKMKEAIGNHMGKVANHPKTQQYNAAYANAKAANPRLFGFKQSDVAKE